ncbi:MAG: single-stranded DNA-binding protein [Leptospiraceae bacterium]|nr:single-stranded DNA-binding protein [Leptospiraceae bacterium]
MNNMALVVLDGNLTADPEQRDAGKQLVARFHVASNHEFGNANDKKFVSFFQIECWNKLAENCIKYLHKGDRVTIQGDLRQDRWQDGDGKSRTLIKVVARSVRFDYTKKREDDKAA